jgi:hypothetical protein
MEKKSAKNCTLYHVVNKSVGADIGATCAGSTNRRRHTDILQLKKFADFLNVCSANILVLTGLQHQYIGAVQGKQKIVCSTTPIRSNDAYSISWSKQKWK